MNQGDIYAKVGADNPNGQPYIAHSNEVDDLAKMSADLEEIINNKDLPEDDRRKAEFGLKLIELRPL